MHHALYRVTESRACHHGSASAIHVFGLFWVLRATKAASPGTPWKLLRLAEGPAAQPFGHGHVWFYSAQGRSSIAPSGGIPDYRYAVYKSPPANVLRAHRHESAAKRPGPLAGAPCCASGGPLTGTSALTAARERRRGCARYSPWSSHHGNASWASHLLFRPPQRWRPASAIRHATM